MRLLPAGLKQRLLVAVCLMSIFPLLVLGYVVSNFVVPNVKTVWDLWIVMALSGFLAFLGWVVIRGVVLPIVRLATQAQAFAEGKTDRPVQVQAPGEVGQLSAALNLITLKARENMEQLRIYGEQTHRLNLEINQRMLALSNILQVSNLITQSTRVDEVLESILEKLAQLDEAELNCVLEPTADRKAFQVKAISSSSRAQADVLLHKKISDPWLLRVMEERQMRVIDGDVTYSHEVEMIQQIFGMNNAVCHPLVCLGHSSALLVSANRKSNFVFREDTLELIGVFAKQASIALENDVLSRRAKELEIVDELTGLFNGVYIRNRLEEEVRRAARYNRPCSLVLVNIDEFRQFQEEYGGLAGEKTLKAMAQLIGRLATEVDRVGRISQDQFALILPEKNKREAIELAESIRTQIAMARFAAGDGRPSQAMTVSAGVSENPIDGSTGQELMTKAVLALEQAKKQGKNRVIAA
ncbi:MAG: diguanylate cyclase [Candidatus Omnitrophica bacterium]|nr:diguanylate cyclase [Candidatus Omnitrophota bacterium]